MAPTAQLPSSLSGLSSTLASSLTFSIASSNIFSSPTATPKAVQSNDSDSQSKKSGFDRSFLGVLIITGISFFLVIIWVCHRLKVQATKGRSPAQGRVNELRADAQRPAVNTTFTSRRHNRLSTISTISPIFSSSPWPFLLARNPAESRPPRSRPPRSATRESRRAIVEDQGDLPRYDTAHLPPYAPDREQTGSPGEMVALESGTQADQDGEDRHDEVPLLRGAAQIGNRGDGGAIEEDVEEDRRTYSGPAPSYHEVAQTNTPPPPSSPHNSRYFSRTATGPAVP
ncbi:hypothetical protein SISSUDRAFT_1032748 [Sistotremastrum suecicum HHB10207 ss-3]|uniref:Uncharacterized protein n=1 Tax=Sistotremastrum suecicum HHB10207 ss-3 TaxID=1314776 RepID=A0A166E8Z8_9AGAM|nr:hypothetical protein SISSUDRAFT_1032748 [Sistotremastrum suecicum HHB10207 ss-3]